MTSSMFAPVDAEAVSGGDPRNTASSTGQQHHNRVGGGVLAVDSLIAATNDGLASNAPASGSDGLSRYEAECTSGLVLSSSVHHQPRSRAQQLQHLHPQNNGNNSHTNNSSQQQQQPQQQHTNGSNKRREDEENYSHRLGVNCPSPYTAEMQPATQFHLNFNPAFAHHGQFGTASFTTPYIPYYPITSSLNPYNNHLQHHHQQQPQQLQQNRLTPTSHVQQPHRNAAAVAAAAVVATAASIGGSGLQQQQQQRSQVPLTSASSLAQSNFSNSVAATCSGGGHGYSNSTSYSFGENKPLGINLELTPTLGNADPRSPSFGGLSSSTDHKIESNSFLARPQPTRLMPGGDLSLSGITAPTTLSNSVVNNNESGQQRSQSSGSPAAALSSSALAFRDKLGLRSPPMGHPSPAASSSINNTTSSGICLSPAAASNDNRCPSRSSTAGGVSNHKFRYPSGPSSASMGSSPHQSVAGEGGCATPLSALSSREGTPIPPPQKVEETAPNVDISRVQIDDSERRALLQHQQFLKNNEAMKSEPNDFLKQESSSVEPMKEEPYDFMKQETMGYQKQESASFNDNFQKYIQEGRDQHQVMLHQQQQQQLMPHPMQQHHHQYPGFGGNNNNPLSPSASDGANNNLRQSITLQQRTNNIYGSSPHAARGLHHAAAYHQTHPGGYSSTIHYHGAGGLGGAGSTIGVSPPSVSGRTAGATGRGGGTSQVKIGRRPSHLPKVLKFQDGTLPPGWVRKLKCRKHGKQAGRWDVYIYSPCGVKFASRKKLKSFFEKNNLNYDPEDFDFTPYGRHSDHSGGRGGGGSGGGASSSGGGRHNSSGSTGSEATHAGSSPASLHNYSPTHLGSAPSSSYLAHSMMTGGFASAGVGEYTPFGTFDPHMENPPNANALDVQRMDTFGTNASGCSTSSSVMADVLVSSANRTTLDYHPGRGHHHPLKTESSDNSYMDMSDFFGDSSTAVAIAGALPLTNGSMYPTGASAAQGNSMSNTDFSDLNHDAMVGNRGTMLSHGLHPMSNASMGSRGSEDDSEEVAVTSKPQDMSELGKAFNVMNDDFHYN